MKLYSAREFALWCMQDANILGAEEVPLEADIVRVMRAISAEMMTLAAKGIVLWSTADGSVPENALAPLGRRMGLAIQPAFGLMDLSDAVAAINTMDKELRALGTRDASYSTQVAEYM